MLNTFLGPLVPPSIASARPPAAGGCRRNDTAERYRGSGGAGKGPPAVGTGGPKTRPPQRRTDGTSGAGVGSAIDRGSGGGDGAAGRRLGGEPERRQEPAHGVGLRHRAQDPPRAAATRTDEDRALE